MLKDKVAIVTGGASGLGQAIATSLCEQHAQVIVFDRDEIALEQLPNTFAKQVVDVTDEQQVQQALNNVIKTHGKINILVNNAGVIYNCPLINIASKEKRVHDYGEYKRMLDINLNSVFLMGSLVAEQMVLNRTKGVIINISSVCAKGNIGQSAYSAAKAGVNALTLCWAKELGAFGIRVVAVAPGFIDTPSTQQALTAAAIADLTKKIPLRKLGKTQNVTDLVLAIITNDYINGSVLDVNGGFSL